MKQIFRYFARAERPDNMLPPPPFKDLIRITTYDEPIDSGNGKMMYGYLDYSTPLTESDIAAFHLEPAPVNPITVPD